MALKKILHIMVAALLLCLLSASGAGITIARCAHTQSVGLVLDGRTSPSCCASLPRSLPQASAAPCMQYTTVAAAVDATDVPAPCHVSAPPVAALPTVAAAIPAVPSLVRLRAAESDAPRPPGHRLRLSLLCTYII